MEITTLWGGACLVLVSAYLFFCRSIFSLKWKHLKSKNDFQRQKTKVLGNAMSADLMPPNQIIARYFSALNSSDILAVFNIFLKLRYKYNLSELDCKDLLPAKTKRDQTSGF